MDLAQYIEQSRQSVAASRQKVENLRVFDFSYVPKNVFLRPETQTLVDALVKFDSTGLPYNLYLFGSRGSGKTVLVKYLQSFLAERIATPIRYLNCRYFNTSTKILAELTGKRPRGLSTTELYNELVKAHEQLILVLDEVDLLSDRERNKDLLYLLSRSEKRYMLILLSNNPGFFEKIDLSARSSLQLERIFFRNYNAVEIGKILEMRCGEGGCRYDPAQLAQISALTCRHNHGDVRVAIKSLQYVLTGRFDSVEDCFRSARQDLYLDLFSDQSDAVLLILHAAAVSEDRLVKPVYGRYAELCGQLREMPYSYMHFYNHLSYLQSIGLVVLVATRVRRGTSNRIELLFDESVLRKVMSRRFGIESQ